MARVKKSEPRRWRGVLILTRSLSAGAPRAPTSWDEDETTQSEHGSTGNLAR